MVSLLGLLLVATSLFGQEQENLDSVQLIKQSTYEYNDNGQKHLESYKESKLDTNRIIIEENRYHYLATDTGAAVVTHYKLVYNPKTRLGSYYTERLPHAKRPNRKYSKVLTKYRSYDHANKKQWEKKYNKSNKLSKEIQNTYDAEGLKIASKITDYASAPPTLHTDEVNRNKAGKMILWESFDDDGTGLKKVRQHKWVYLDDTLLLASSGYIYNNWTEVKNKYKKGVLTKTITQSGNRQSNGKVKITYKTLKEYKEGQLTKEMVFSLNKKELTKTYTYQEGITTELIQTKEGTTTNVLKEIFDGNLLIEESSMEKGEPKFMERYTYNPSTQKLLEKTEIEYRRNNKEWKTITKYNISGNIVSKTFYVNNKPVRDDVYEYVYYK